MRLKDRAKHILGTEIFKNVCGPEEVMDYTPVCPHERQYILRMQVRAPHGDFKIPKELHWLMSLIKEVSNYQENVLGIRQPYCYVTVRHGVVTSEKDDEFHVDGFSTKISHLPEQNYIVGDSYPTEYTERSFNIPSDFNPLVHNLQWYLQNTIKDEDIKTCEANKVYCMDPYVPHRRVSIPDGTVRTFIRISFTPIQIMDDNNTENPLLPIPKFNRDGVAIREALKRYDVCH